MPEHQPSSAVVTGLSPPLFASPQHLVMASWSSPAPAALPSPASGASRPSELAHHPPADPCSRTPPYRPPLASRPHRGAATEPEPLRAPRCRIVPAPRPPSTFAEVRRQRGDTLCLKLRRADASVDGRPPESAGSPPCQIVLDTPTGTPLPRAHHPSVRAAPCSCPTATDHGPRKRRAQNRTQAQGPRRRAGAGRDSLLEGAFHSRATSPPPATSPARVPRPNFRHNGRDLPSRTRVRGVPAPPFCSPPLSPSSSSVPAPPPRPGRSAAPSASAAGTGCAPEWSSTEYVGAGARNMWSAARDAAQRARWGQARGRKWSTSRPASRWPGPAIPQCQRSARSTYRTGTRARMQT